MPITSEIVQELTRAGKVHHDAVHAPDAFEVRLAYDALKRETLAQFEALMSTGWSFSFSNVDPYANSQELRDDAKNRSSRVYTGGDLPADHPLAEMTSHGQSYNTLFRAIHDVLGHVATGTGFGPSGELCAFQEHAKAFSGEALPALMAETYAQNAFVNFGPHNPQKLPASLRPFADQKAYAFPISKNFIP